MKIFAANWKLNKNPEETRMFIEDFIKLLKSKSDKGLNKTQNKIIIFPPALCLESAIGAFKSAGTSFSEFASIQFGIQNVYCESKGAFTGENSASVARDIGAKWVLVGHSERRALFKEQNELLAKKVKLVQELDLIPMYCIGETLQEREAGKTNSVLSDQLMLGLKESNAKKPIAIAYEPVWAIGTGKVASLEQIKETHAFIRMKLTEIGLPVATPVLYGGSVKAETSKEMIQISNVDGLLVGGASLEPLSFSQICLS